MLFLKMIAVFCENFTVYINTLNEQHAAVKYYRKLLGFNA
jgi:hypothetical protein